MSHDASMLRPHRHTTRFESILAFVAAGLVLSACGAEAPLRATTPDPKVAEPASRLPDEEPEGDDEVIAPTPAAVAAGRRFDELVAAYAPVSERVNFLVAAETLRSDAVESGAGKDVEKERFGAVHVEIGRMIEEPKGGILVQARAKVAGVVVDSVEQRHVQDLMLAAIDARMSALRQLRVALRALVNPDIPDSQVEVLEDRWQASWDLSLRRAREATSAVQESRALLALQPEPEESIR